MILEYQKTAKATGELIGNNCASEIKRVSKNSQVIYKSPEQTQKIIDNLKLI